MFYWKAWLCSNAAQPYWLTGKLVSSSVTLLLYIYFVGISACAWLLFGVECCWMASTALTKKGKIAVVELVTDLVEILYTRCSPLSLFKYYCPRQRSDWLEYESIRQVKSCLLSLVSRVLTERRGFQ